MSRINFALVGCGKIAKKHVHVIENYLEDAAIVGFCDLDIERAKEFAAKSGASAYGNIKEMMEDLGDKVDIVCVLTPSGAHAQNVSELAGFGKSLVVEKPIALKLEDADEIIRLCDLNGIKIFIVHQNRYNLPVMKAREAFEQGRFGKMVMGTIRLRWKRDQEYYDSADWRGTWGYDGGVFTNQASHLIDMLTWFMGDVVSVKAIAATRLVDIECEDTGAALVKFSSGAIGIIEATTATRPKDLEGSISVLGENGSVVIGGFFMNELDTWEFNDMTPADKNAKEDFGTNPEGWGYNLGEYLNDVIRSIKSDKAGLVDGLEGRKSLELISAIYESIETGTEIDIRFRPKRCKLGIL